MTTTSPPPNDDDDDDAFKILPCELADMSVCIDIFDEAFARDPAVIYRHPRCDPRALRERALQKYAQNFAVSGTRFFKAVCGETGQVVAFSKWIYPHTPEPEAEDPETAIRNEPQLPGSNTELVIEFQLKCLGGRQKWLVPETHYFMSILAVRPEYQRKGLGSRLLRPVLELADKDRAKTYIQASKEGLGLYLKHGWVEVDEIVMDFSPYGGPEKVRTALLIREPKE